MSGNIRIDDYITPIKKIIDSRETDTKDRLRKFIYHARKINNRHLYKHSVDKTVKRLLEPQWRARISRFNPDEWRKTTKMVWLEAKKILGAVPPPEIVLYPGFGAFNGRVYKVDKKPVIGGSPDFPYTTGINLKVLLAHEYGHFIRWRKIGIPSDNAPIYLMIYDEGWATWLSIKLLPEITLSRLFMSNLHKAINMPDPKGGYLKWCRKNLKTIAIETRKVLKSKNDKVLGRFFQCLRFKDDKTPIRIGYYLGYRLIDMLSKKIPLHRLLIEKPTPKKVSEWIEELVDVDS